MLCQQIVALCALDEWAMDDLVGVIRGAAPFAELSDEVLGSVLDLLSGRYPSEEFAELRPRIVWDRVEGTVRGRSGAQRLAVTNSGTIPDRGLFTVTLPDGTRVGELDEEMVYESRPGETFLLGASTWRIEDITFQKVIVTPAPGVPGKMPFWHGDGPGRPLELGRAIGAFDRELRAGANGGTDPVQRLRDGGLDDRAATNLVAYLDEQAEATGVVPDDRTIVVERFRDEIGDWRICVLSPFGAQVHAPWAMALQHRLGEKWGMAVELMWSDDGIVIRLPESVDELPDDDLLIDPDEIEELIVSQLPSTAMFASRFRECAARALLLPKRRPDQRTPLWQQRQRSADLLSVAGKYPSFPILLEATRECLNDVFDVPALTEVLRDLRSRKVRLVSVDSQQASPFAQSLMFGWIAVYMYAGDAPLAERRAAALALDRDLLRDLLGAEELRELIDADVLADLELELQRLVEGRLARDVDEAHDQLRLLGPLSVDELGLRSVDGAPVKDWVDQLVAERRAFLASIAGEERVCAAEDAGRLRDALGVAVPVGLPHSCTDSVPTPLLDLVARYARTHGPFLVQHAADPLRPGRANRCGPPSTPSRPRAGWSAASSAPTAWSASGATTTSSGSSGADRWPPSARRWSRSTPPPSPGSSRAGTASAPPRRGVDALVDVVAQLQGAPLVASALDRDVLRARLPEHQPADLDALCTSGDVVWVGAGAIGSSDGRIRLAFRDQAGLLLSPVEGFEPDALHTALLEHLEAQRAPRSGPTSRGPPRRPASPSTTPRSSPRCGTSCGRASSPTTRSRRCAPSSAPPAADPPAARRPAAGPRGRPRPGRLSRLGPPAGAGRWSLVGAAARPRPHGHRGRPRSRAAAARALRRAHPRGRARRGRRGRVRRRVPGAQGARGARPGAARLLRGRARGGAVRGAGRRRPAAQRARWRRPSHRSCWRPPIPPSPSAPPCCGPSRRAARPAPPGALVVLAGADALAYLERGAHKVLLFPAAADDDRWAARPRAARGHRPVPVARDPRRRRRRRARGRARDPRLPAAGRLPAGLQGLDPPPAPSADGAGRGVRVPGAQGRRRRDPPPRPPGHASCAARRPSRFLADVAKQGSAGRDGPRHGELPARQRAHRRRPPAQQALGH